MPLQLSHIVKLRVQHGERCAEVQWLPRTELGMQIPATTLEPLTIFTEAYSAVWEEFEQEQLGKYHLQLILATNSKFIKSNFYCKIKF
jgi:hypothetical protein